MATRLAKAAAPASLSNTPPFGQPSQLRTKKSPAQQHRAEQGYNNCLHHH